MLRMPNTAGQVAEVPALAGPNQVAAPVRTETERLPLSDDRLPRPVLPPMLRVVVEEPLL
jgi:hypothetical protein